MSAMSVEVTETGFNLIPAGYKQTEVGVIPEDWVIRNIGDFAPLQRGFDLPSANRVNGKYPVVYSNGIVNTHCHFKVKGPGVVTGRSGTLGKVHYVEADYWPHNTSLWVTKFNETNPKFIYFIFTYIDFERFASGSGVPTLNRNDAHSFKIAIPASQQEQTAIANALSDVDLLISELEKLIAKKQAIKTATMQQLLTGRTRLPQFALREDGSKKGTKQSELGEIPEDWNLVSLQNMATPNGLVRGPFGGAIKKEHFTKTGYKVYEQRNAIYGTINIGNYYIDQKKFDELKRFSISHNDFIVSCSGTIGRIYQIPNKYPMGVINQALLKITLNKSIDSKYFYHYFKWDEFQERIIDGTQGGAMKNLVGMAEFKQSLMPLPTMKEEQTAIATILSDMDEEIQVLEQRISKTRQIKQGMMQELLTGKTRLVHGENS